MYCRTGSTRCILPPIVVADAGAAAPRRKKPVDAEASPAFQVLEALLDAPQETRRTRVDLKGART